jgi:hypothetical protein
MATTEEYQQKLEESADRVKVVFDAISTCIKALDGIPYKVFKDPDLKRELDEKIVGLETAIAALR